MLNIKCVSVSWWLYVLSNTLATFEAQFMKKSNNTESELKKALLIKKCAYCTPWDAEFMSYQNIGYLYPCLVQVRTIGLLVLP